MKKWGVLWFIVTIIDALAVTYFSLTGKGISPTIIAFDFSQFWHNIPYWYDSIWYVFNIIAVNGLFTIVGYFFFKKYKQHNKKINSIWLFILLYMSFGALILLAIYRFDIIYPSYLYYPFTVESIRLGMLAFSVIFLLFYLLGFLTLHFFYKKTVVFIYTVLLALCYYPYLYGYFNQNKNSYKQKDVIFILLDAVRYDHLEAGGAPFDIMPKLNKIIREEGVFYKDTTVSVGRSFPSATAILTAQHAINNGARDNLFPKNEVNYKASLAHTFQENGYQTALSNDGFQFYNFDKDYGFDHIWAAGTSVIKMAPLELGGRMPLPLLFANTRISELFFPYIYGDRNIDDLYQTDTYIHKVNRNLNFLDANKPLFYLLDMNLTHLPFADETEYSKGISANLKGDYEDACNYYLASMNHIDNQLFKMIATLKKHGRLDNALLVIGSDHGQGFDMDKDRVFTTDGVFAHGEGYYGNNAFNKSSTQMVLSFFEFGNKIEFKKGIRAKQVESVDIMPTILELLNITIDRSIDGTSFAHNLLTGADETEKYRFVESGVVMNLARSDGLEGMDINKLSQHVEVDLNTLIQQWGKKGGDIIVTTKERAVYWGDWALVSQNIRAFPVVINRKDNIAWNLSQAPSDVPLGNLLERWCEYNQKDLERLAPYGVTKENIIGGLCYDPHLRASIIEKAKENGMYQKENYKDTRHKLSKNPQFFCTRKEINI